MTISDEKIVKWTKKGKVSKLIMAMDEVAFAQAASDGIMSLVESDPKRNLCKVLDGAKARIEKYGDTYRGLVICAAENHFEDVAWLLIGEALGTYSLKEVFVDEKEFSDFYSQNKQPFLELLRATGKSPSEKILKFAKTQLNVRKGMFDLSAIVETKKIDGERRCYLAKLLFSTYLDTVIFPLIDLTNELKGEKPIVEALLRYMDYALGLYISGISEDLKFLETLKSFTGDDKKHWEAYQSDVETVKRFASKRTAYVSEHLLANYPALQYRNWHVDEFQASSTYNVDSSGLLTPDKVHYSWTWSPKPHRAKELFLDYTQGMQEDGILVSE